MPSNFELHDRESIANVHALVHDIIQVREAKQLYKLWFRGHSRACFGLVPTIDRPAEYAGFTKSFNPEDEKQLVHRFRRRAYPLDKNVEHAGYAIFLARHHGLPTRLLDWTANPLFALYFSRIEHLDTEGQLRAFKTVAL